MVLSHALLLHDVGKDRVDFRIFQDKHTQKDRQEVCYNREQQSVDYLSLIKGSTFIILTSHRG